MKQVVPPSITGLEGVAAASVVDHRFGDSEPYTLGVEEEYMLLDPESLDLVQHIETVLDAVEGDVLEARPGSLESLADDAEAEGGLLVGVRRSPRPVGWDRGGACDVHAAVGDHRAGESRGALVRRVAADQPTFHWHA